MGRVGRTAQSVIPQSPLVLGWACSIGITACMPIFQKNFVLGTWRIVTVHNRVPEAAAGYKLLMTFSGGHNRLSCARVVLASVRNLGLASLSTGGYHRRCCWPRIKWTW